MVLGVDFMKSESRWVNISKIQTLEMLESELL